MTAIKIIRHEDAVAQRWRNNAGWTREIARAGEGDDWDWRISIAEVETDGPFSMFPGVEREIVLLAGAGMQLQFDDGEAHALTRLTPRLRFSGDRLLDARLIDGPTRDFNLMWARERISASLWLHTIEGHDSLTALPGDIWLVHVTRGQITTQGCEGRPLRVGDTLCMFADLASAMLDYEGSGQLIVVRIRAVQVA